MKNNPLIQTAVGATVPHTSANADGLTLRDYFAAAALSGMLSNPNWSTDIGKANQQSADAAYDYADAMLAQRLIH